MRRSGQLDWARVRPVALESVAWSDVWCVMIFVFCDACSWECSFMGSVPDKLVWA